MPSPIVETTEPDEFAADLASTDSLSPPTDLARALAEVESIVPPLWPLQDYVAVNPFLGLSDRRFLPARKLLRSVRDCELLPPAAAFRAQLASGEISPADVADACRQVAQEYPEYSARLAPHVVLRAAQQQAGPSGPTERRYLTVAEVIDQHELSGWSSHVVNDVTRCCAAHFDQGHANWQSPWKHLTLYQAWREAALVSRRMDHLGLRGFRELVRSLPLEPVEALAEMLAELEAPAEHWRDFLLCQACSVAGWASFVRYRVSEGKAGAQGRQDLAGLLAMRLAYDVALARSQPERRRAWIVQFAGPAATDGARDMEAPSIDVLARYVLQVASERTYRRKLAAALVQREPTDRAQRRTAQGVFCIDVRSEVMRRHLESLSDSIETFGFAGFFGMALEYLPFGESSGAAQCPVLLKPGFQVVERVLGASEVERGAILENRRTQRSWRKVWKGFQSSAVSCFSFVESLGLLYLPKLATDSLRLTRPVPCARHDGLSGDRTVSLGPDLRDPCSLTQAKKVDLAAGMLGNLGLKDGFARIVMICGHAADIVNNPYQAGLDCGACGGHSGLPNARVAAALLNERQVREGLAARGIVVPDDTWFVPAVHNTTTDQIEFFDVNCPASHTAEFAQLQTWVAQAGELCRRERARRLHCSAGDTFRRSRDWSEVRPEWGLASNAAFIVAPRARTAGLDLGGRAFMHSYDQRQDPDLKVLELIMTAPMVVASWINLQYYASAVDNRSFGSGNKAIHNVVGQFGVLLGNGGDLMTGLPWQSVHDGAQLQHQPLRLLVVIESARDSVQRIIDKHALVRDLVSNGWLTLIVIEGKRCFRWTSIGGWEEESDS